MIPQARAHAQYKLSSTSRLVAREGSRASGRLAAAVGPALIALALLATVAHAASSSEVALFDGVQVPDGTSMLGSAPIGKFRHVTLFGTSSNGAPGSGTVAGGQCWFLLGPGTDLASAPNLVGPDFSMEGGTGILHSSAQPGSPVAGDTLVCQVSCPGGCTVVLKALFTK
jgi:hypothetical protein